MGITIESIRRMQEMGMPDEDIQAFIDGWARCLECEERRAKDASRQQRYRDKFRDSHVKKKSLPHTPSKEKTIPTSSDDKSSSEVAPLSEVFPTRKDLEEAVSEWNELAQDAGLPKVLRLTPQRRRALTARLRELGSLDAWVDVLVKICGSPFCRGENDRGWRANFDFALRPTVLAKIMEGNYEPVQRQGGRNR